MKEKGEDAYDLCKEHRSYSNVRSVTITTNVFTYIFYAELAYVVHNIKNKTSWQFDEDSFKI